MRRAYRVDLHRPQFPAVVGHDPYILVAERRLAGRTTGLCLLLHALDDLVGEVAAVELGDRTHDAVQQHAAWRLVDVLGGRDQLSPRLLDYHVNLGVVETIPREAIDLVHDDIVDRRCL
nr:hypothetical protein [Mycolicibacterium grossiae]